MRAHLAVAAKNGHAAARAALDGPGLPDGFAYLWHWFLDLHVRRGSGVNGPAGISWADLDAWQRITGADPLPWELDVIAALDNAFFAATHPSKPEPGKAKAR